MSIQVLNPGPTVAQAAGKGLLNTFDPIFQRQIQQSQLEKALAPLGKPGFETQPYTQQLSQLLPALLTTPGGAQLAGELAPVLSQRASNAAYLDYIKSKRTKEQIGELSPKKPTGENLGVEVIGPEGEPIRTEGYRKPEERGLRHPESVPSEKSTYPIRATENEVVKPYTPQEMEQAVQNILESGAMMGKPIDPAQAWNIVNQEQANRIKQNELVAAEQTRAEEAYDKRAAQGLAKARNSGLIKEEFETPIFENFLDKHSNLANPTEQYQAAERDFRTYRQARDQLEREFNAPNPIEAVYRKLNGSYKSKEDIIKGMQPQINTFKKLGLIEPLRAILSNTVGLGPEDIETAIFPPTKQERQYWNNIPKNPTKLARTGPQYGYPEKVTFPGEDYNSAPESFKTLKNSIIDTMTKFPETNLVSLRGFLNQENRWSWQDISKAINEAMEEGFIDEKDQILQQQKFIINNSPTPGMANLFDHILRGTK